MTQKEFTMRFCLIAMLIAALCSCGVNEVNSRGYIISQSHKEEVLLGEEDEITP